MMKDRGKYTPGWIDPLELDELERRHPTIERAILALALESAWPRKDQIDVTIEHMLERAGQLVV